MHNYTSKNPLALRFFFAPTLVCFTFLFFSLIFFILLKTQRPKDFSLISALVRFSWKKEEDKVIGGIEKRVVYIQKKKKNLQKSSLSLN